MALLTVGVGFPTNALGQTAKSGQENPSAVAHASFQSLKKRDLNAMVAYMHPQALEQFKEFAITVFKFENPDDEVKQIRAALAPFSTLESVEKASGAELLRALLKNSLEKIEGLDEMLAGAKLQVLGEIAETDEIVHVVTRSVVPRPSPTTCKQWQGSWYQMLSEDQLRLARAFEQKAHFRAKKLKAEDILRKTTLGTVEVVGHVSDGDDLVQVLCRIEGQIEDFKYPIFACYPVRRGEPAWDLLQSKDKEPLVKALRAKWQN